MNKYWQILILVVLGVAALFLIPQKHALAPSTQVTDFITCKQAGGNITDSEQGQVCTPPSGECCFLDNQTAPEVVVDQPAYGAVVNSPLTVSGQAKGFWFFEASLPVILKDDQGNVLVQTPANAQADWMTTDYVPFTATLNFNPGNAQYGVLIINKDNPSGDTSKDASFAVPVRFR